MSYVIWSYIETIAEEEPMFWNNDDGWGDLSSATVFTDEDKENLSFLPNTWVKLPEGK
jgi:hypothetical protein